MKPEILASVACLAGGVLVARRSRRAAFLVCASLLPFLAASALWVRRPDLIPWDLLLLLESRWLLMPGFLLVGIGLWTARASLPRRMIMYGGLVALALVQGVELHVLPRDYSGLAGRADAEGICRQSTGFTCAPASLVTYLYGRGIRTTEAEMARLCGTTLLGTSDRGMLAALYRLGLKPRISMGDPLDRSPTPCMAVVAFASGIDHCVVLTGVGEEEVEVIDPLGGRTLEDRAAFERRWKGVLIWAD